MFRKMRRSNQALEKDECISLLKTVNRGTLAVNGDDGYPYAFGVNFIYDEKDSCIYIHGSKVGHKIDSIKKSNKVSFTLWNDGEKKEGDWAYTIKSVVIFGRAILIDDIEIATQKVRSLAYKYYPDKNEAEIELQNGIKYVQLIKIEIEHMSGKVIHEK